MEQEEERDKEGLDNDIHLLREELSDASLVHTSDDEGVGLASTESQVNEGNQRNSLGEGQNANPVAFI